MGCSGLLEAAPGLLSPDQNKKKTARAWPAKIWDKKTLKFLRKYWYLSMQFCAIIKIVDFCLYVCTFLQGYSCVWKISIMYPWEGLKSIEKRCPFLIILDFCGFKLCAVIQKHWFLIIRVHFSAEVVFKSSKNHWILLHFHEFDRCLAWISLVFIVPDD